MANRVISIIASALILGLSGNAFAQTAGRTNVVPDRFLRGYDPVTVFYSQAHGPDGGGPADGPGPFLSLEPSIPGEYRWVDQKTIQFLPAVPWPPLSTVTIRTRDRNLSLSTMMVPPSGIHPAAGSTGLEPFSAMTLVFPARLKATDLSRMLSFEVRDLPGVDQSTARTLDPSSYTVRELEQTGTATSSTFRISFRQAFDFGKRVIMRVRLAQDEAIRDSVAAFSFDTRQEFRLVALGNRSTRLPISQAGALYARDQAMDSGTGSDPLWLEFSEGVRPPSIETIKNMVRFEPAVSNLRAEWSGSRLNLRFDADREQLYKVTLVHQPLQSSTGRSLSPFGESVAWFYYRQSSPYITWRLSQGLVERYGPKMLPMEGRALSRLDVRIHRIDPLSANFWPYPTSPVSIRENSRPPMPGEEPAPGTNLSAQIRLLPGPDLSRLMDLPIQETSGATRFGLDLAADLERIAGKDKPGTYLVGYRPIGNTDERFYVRFTVTDLVLSSVEEEDGVVFVVTSMATGRPVAGAQVSIETEEAIPSAAGGGRRYVSQVGGSTDALGMWRYRHTTALKQSPSRVVVKKDDDILVISTGNPPPVFANNHWFEGQRGWLGWLTERPQAAKHQTANLSWLLTERPVYRPEENVHIIAWMRSRRDGRLVEFRPDEALELVISNDAKEFRVPVTLTEGRVYHEWKEKTEVTGDYQVILRGVRTGTVHARTTFKKEAYRVPTFSLTLSGSERVALDRPFITTLTADYYAGGRVVGQKVDWSVTQFPYSLSSPRWPGFLFSSDERFYQGSPWNNWGATTSEGELDTNGSATLELNPALEQDGRARRYLIEATVMGADSQSVTTARQVYALPPFNLGLRLPRLVRGETAVRPGILALDHNLEALKGLEVELRLIQRQWHSYVSETDISTGEPRFTTQTVDKVIEERKITTLAEVLELALPVPESGVYLVELAARDQLGRRVTVQSDTFVSGDTAQSWERKPSGLFELQPDKPSYKPGDTARIVIKSPWQDAFALIVTEGPESNTYLWVPVKNGQGIAEVPINGPMAPNLPISALLVRGRGAPAPGEGRVDLARPASLGASLQLAVEAVTSQAVVTLKHAPRATPGAKLPIDIEVNDPSGRPLDGWVSLWLVDRAVLALGTEASLDPLPNFIKRHESWVRIRDTRNLALGRIPFEEVPGGDGALEEALRAELMSKITVRDNFKTVPYFNPTIRVVRGRASVIVDLPDNLTEFAIRAVATSGMDRLGSVKSSVAIRLPVIVQSAIPRFIRPGDGFNAGAVVRVVEGPGGPGIAGISVKDLLPGPGIGEPVEGQTNAWTRSVVLPDQEARRVNFPLLSPIQLQSSVTPQVEISMYVGRVSDGARDAFRIPIPVRDDLGTKMLASLYEARDGTFSRDVPAPTEAYRAGTLSRTVIISRDPRLLRFFQASVYLNNYEHGCLEQRVSMAWPALLARTNRVLAPIFQGPELTQANLNSLMLYATSTQKTDGLYGYWPGVKGSVTLTAWYLDFLADARDAGLSIDTRSVNRATQGLRDALRSDSRALVSGWQDIERIDALHALARFNIWEESYANQLRNNSQNLSAYAQARLIKVYHLRKLGSQGAVQNMARRLDGMVVTTKANGVEVFSQLQDRSARFGGPILQSETRTLVAVLEALALADPRSAKLSLLSDAILAQSGDEGWGSTIDNASVLRVLKVLMDAKVPRNAAANAELVYPGGRRVPVNLGSQMFTITTFSDAAPVSIRITGGVSATDPAWVLAIASYKPGGRGAEVKAVNNGFLVTREALRIGPNNQILSRHPATAGQGLVLPLETVLEERVKVTNPEDRDFVAITVPLAAGLEPLNPALAGAPREATPLLALTRQPDYAMYLDDRVVFYYLNLPRGTYDFAFRTRASFGGIYSVPPARAELMYRLTVTGGSPGLEVRVQEEPGAR